MNNNFLKAVEGLMRGICNQSPNKTEVRIIQQEIDYDELAKAIVRANEASKERELTKKDSSANVLSAISSGIFYAFGAMFLLLTVGICYGAYKTVPTLEWNDVEHVIASAFVLFFSIALFAAMLGMCIESFRAANQVSIERDRNYVVAVASTLASMAALAVALVSLFKK